MALSKWLKAEVNEEFSFERKRLGRRFGSVLVPSSATFFPLRLKPLSLGEIGSTCRVCCRVCVCGGACQPFPKLTPSLPKVLFPGRVSPLSASTLSSVFLQSASKCFLAAGKSGMAVGVEMPLWLFPDILYCCDPVGIVNGEDMAMSWWISTKSTVQCTI